jgi:L-alanine-DL-glutamate epimerase-like enolase superfamily enzyme
LAAVDTALWDIRAKSAGFTAMEIIGRCNNGKIGSIQYRYRLVEYSGEQLVQEQKRPLRRRVPRYKIKGRFGRSTD